MDPIEAWKRQQKRLGNDSNTQSSASAPELVAEMRIQHPDWAEVFDQLDTWNKGVLSRTDCIKACRLLGGTDFVIPPMRKLDEVFQGLEVASGGELSFFHLVKFYEALQNINQERAATIESRKPREAGDIFDIVGVRKSREMRQVEARKSKAMERRSISRLTIAGESAVASVPLGQSRSARSCVRFDDSPGVAMARSASNPADVHRQTSFGADSQVMRALPSFGQMTSMNADHDQPLDYAQGSASSASRIVQPPTTIRLATSLPQLVLPGPAVACLSVRFSPDGGQLAAGFFDGGLRIYDADTTAMRHCLGLPEFQGGTVRSDQAEDVVFREQLNDVALTCVQWRPGQRTSFLGTTDTNGAMKLWSIPTGRRASAPPTCSLTLGGSAPLDALAFTPDGERVAVGGTQRYLKVFDLTASPGGEGAEPLFCLGAGAALPGRIGGHALKVVSLRAHPDNPNILYSGGMDRKVLLWDCRSGQSAVSALHGVELAGDSIDVSKDGVRVLTGSHRSADPIQIHDLRKPTEEDENAEEQQAQGDGLVEYIAAEERTPCQSFSWRGDEGESPSGRQQGDSCLVISCAWDYDNRTIVAAGESENAARIFETPTLPDRPLKVVGSFWGSSNAYWCAAITADCRAAAFGCCDGGIVLAALSKK